MLGSSLMAVVRDVLWIMDMKNISDAKRTLTVLYAGTGKYWKLKKPSRREADEDLEVYHVLIIRQEERKIKEWNTKL